MFENKYEQSSQFNSFSNVNTNILNSKRSQQIFSPFSNKGEVVDLCTIGIQLAQGCLSNPSESNSFRL